MTNNWVDIKNANLILVQGGNPAEAHPVGFRWAIEAKKNGAKIIVVDPRFNRTASVADLHAPIRSGSDIAFLMGVIRYLLETNQIQHEYVKHYTNASYLVNEGYKFEDGLFSGFNEEKHSYDKSTWNYQFDENGHPKRDMTLQDPRCVINVLKEHVARYTPEVVENITGVKQKLFLQICEEIGKTSAPNKTMTHLYALGFTEHTIGTQNIRSMAMIQLLLGNIGMPGGGINALRGHSNVQGTTDMGLLPTMLPGYMRLPTEKESSFDQFINAITPKDIVPNQINYYRNTPKFFISMMKTFYGDKATKENSWGFDYLPKVDRVYDPITHVKMMHDGEMHGWILQGFNVLNSLPNKNKTVAGMSKLKYLIVLDPLQTESSEFWRNFGESNEVDSSKIQTEVFRLPTTCFAEEDGSIANSGRWAQWHQKSCDQPGEALPDADIFSMIREEMHKLYKSEGGHGIESFEAMTWNYDIPHSPSPTELAKELNGYALEDLYDANGNLMYKKGQLLNAFAHLRDDGTTTSGNWLYVGQWTEKGNQTENRDNSDPSGLGCTLGWGFAWPANRRVLYSRASLDINGNPWDKHRQLIKWNGKNWNWFDIADYGTQPPGSDTRPFMMSAEGVGRLFAVDKINSGPFPEHYEPIESPIDTNPLHPNVVSDPTVRIYKEDREFIGSNKEYPFVATTYRLTEHFHSWTAQSAINIIAQPQQFVEIGEKLAEEKGIQKGDMVRITSKRGYIKAVAVVTKRLRALEVNGKTVHHVGIPIHWNMKVLNGKGNRGFSTNTLTPSWGESVTQTPEYKTFLVNVEKIAEAA
ncbi:formate dehydrogenase, nitrate-inducible, majorsubunit, putative' [Aggregatibacter actinomycetemcomitans HK1651]|nr:formate dehydrogenase, nitrate-inducible, majorsubunit, putative' [Aggregatibacter actinomycetemcomitans HK1651]